MAAMPVLHALADRIDRLSAAIGRAAAWLALAIVVLQFALVVARYLLGLGSIWLGETVIYANAALFLLASAWTLHSGGHVRVDVFYAHVSPRARARIDLLGSLVLLLPFALVLLALSSPYAARSWAILERSQESSGLPLVFLLKTLIPVFAVLMALQGVAQAIRAFLSLTRLRGRVAGGAGRVGD
jgi:TRAP-type mannitol/chloroaromatic compound transport system permease small subunit